MLFSTRSMSMTSAGVPYSRAIFAASGLVKEASFALMQVADAGIRFEASRIRPGIEAGVSSHYLLPSTASEGGGFTRG